MILFYVLINNVEITSPENEVLKIQVADILGKTIYSQDAELVGNIHRFTVDLSGNEAGMYFLVIRRKDEAIVIRKLILTR